MHTKKCEEHTHTHTHTHTHITREREKSSLSGYMFFLKCTSSLSLNEMFMHEKEKAL